MIRSEEIDLREGLVYDPAVKLFDSSFWKGDTANSVFDTANNVIRIGDSGLVGSISSYSQYLYGDFEYTIQLDSLSPDSNDSEKIWGLWNLGDSDRRGSVYFSASFDTSVDTATTRQLWVEVRDEAGTRQRKRITFDTLWSSTLVRYRIRWEAAGYTFLINDTVYATLADRPDTSRVTFQINTAIPQALRLSNRTADDTALRLRLLTIRHARKVI